MASAPIDEIDLAALLPFGWLLAWSAVLAVTTFAPLIQLAAVKSTPTTPATPTGTSVASPASQNTPTAPSAPSAQSGGHSEAVSATPAPAEQTGAMSGQPEGQPEGQPGKGKVSAADRQTIINMSANGIKASAIANQMQLNENTVRSIIARASKPTVHVNGTAKE